MHNQGYSTGFSHETLGANAPYDNTSAPGALSTNINAQIAKLQELANRLAHITYQLNNKNEQMFGNRLKAKDTREQLGVEPDGLLSQLNLAIINLDTEVADLENVTSVTLTI